MADALAETRNSIEQANRSTTAMESIAASLATSAESVQKSIAITQRIADDNFTAFITSTRAFLHVRSFAVEWDKSDPRIIVSVANSGRLAAVITGWAADCVLGPLPGVPPAEELVYYGNAGPVAPDNTTVTLTAIASLNWTRDDWRDLLTDQRRLCIWGVIEYDSGFPNKPGKLGFGFEFDGTGLHGTYGERFAATDAPGYNYSQ
jgi:hypothetical protein